MALLPVGLIHKQLHAHAVQLRFNRVQARPRRGVPVAYWIASLLPWRLDAMEDRLHRIGVQVDL